MADDSIAHLLRRAGFGATSGDLAIFNGLSYNLAVDRLLNYDAVPDDVDSKLGQSGFMTTTSNGPFSPNTVINDARQRWLFRMVHTNRPLQEKMTLFWHNHFATGYTKVAGLLGAVEGTRYMASKLSDDPIGVRGQIEMLRDNALGNFDLLVICGLCKLNPQCKPIHVRHIESAQSPSALANVIWAARPSVLR